MNATGKPRRNDWYGAERNGALMSSDKRLLRLPENLFHTHFSEESQQLNRTRTLTLDNSGPTAIHSTEKVV